MPRSCVAYGCTNSSAKLSCKEKNISFHRFPLKDTSRLLLWIFQIKRRNFVPNEHSVLCSEHFSEDNFEYIGCGKKKALKKNAVPNKFVYARVTSKRKREFDESGSPLTSEPIVCHLSKKTSEGSVQTEKGIIDALVAEINYLKEENAKLHQMLESSATDDNEKCLQDLVVNDGVLSKPAICCLNNESFGKGVQIDKSIQTEMEIVEILEAEILLLKQKNTKPQALES